MPNRGFEDRRFNEDWRRPMPDRWSAGGSDDTRWDESYHDERERAERRGYGEDWGYGGMYRGYEREPYRPSVRERFRQSASDWGRDRGYGSSEHPNFAERMAERLWEGVVHRTGKPPKNYRRSDERIREDVYDRLMRAPINCENIDVTVKEGEVTLTGTVEHRQDKRRVEDCIEDVLGVHDVHNQLRVDRGDSLPLNPPPGAPRAARS